MLQPRPLSALGKASLGQKSALPIPPALLRIIVLMKAKLHNVLLQFLPQVALVALLQCLQVFSKSLSNLLRAVGLCYLQVIYNNNKAMSSNVY